MSKKGNIRDIVHSVKSQLIEIKDEKVQDDKISKCMDLLDFLTNCNEPEVKQVLEIFSNALLDDCTAKNCKLDVKKYFKLLFPAINYEIVHIKRKLKDYKKPEEKSNVDKLSHDNMVIVTTDDNISGGEMQKINVDDCLNKSEDKIDKPEQAVDIVETTNPVLVGATGPTNPVLVGVTGPTSYDEVKSMVQYYLTPHVPVSMVGPSGESDSKKQLKFSPTLSIEPVHATRIREKYENKQEKKTIKKSIRKTYLPRTQPKSEPQALGNLVSQEILEQQRTNLRKVNRNLSKIEIIDDFYANTKLKDKPKDSNSTEPATVVCNNKVSVVFYDTQKQIFIKINYDTDLQSSILADLCMKYQISDKNKIQILLENNKSLDSFKNDPEFPAGPFLIKSNDNIYDAYEKVVSIKIIEGYIYNSSLTIVEIKHLGKYGILFV